MDWFLRFEKLVTDLDSSCPIADALERGRECVERLKAARQSAAEVEAAAKGERDAAGPRCKAVLSIECL